MSQSPVPTPVNPVAPPLGTGPGTFNTPYRIITFAMRDAKLIGRGELPTSEDLAEYMTRLNDIINFLQTKGLKLWLQEDLYITPIAGVNLYSWGPGGTVVCPRPPRFLEGYWQDNLGGQQVPTGARRPLICISRNEWDYLSTTVTQGQVSSYFTDKQQLLTNLYLWLTPDQFAAENGVVHMLAQVQVNNMLSLTDTMNFPIEWFLALHWALGYDISQGQPGAVTALCAQNAKTYLDALEGWDVEDASTFFQTDQRTQYTGYRFR